MISNNLRSTIYGGCTKCQNDSFKTHHSHGEDLEVHLFSNQIIGINYNILKHTCLFIYFKTKAVHLYCVSSLWTEAFLDTTQFIGRSHHFNLYNDHGTNFIGVSCHFNNLYRHINSDFRLMETITQERVNWKLILFLLLILVVYRRRYKTYKT